jgi:hypothetical protein
VNYAFPTKHTHRPTSPRLRSIGRQMVELLRRITAAGLADRFTLRAVCPRDASFFDLGLEHLIARGLAEVVTEGCGRWHYRLTEAGRSAAAAGVIPPPPVMRTPERIMEPTHVGRYDGRASRGHYLNRNGSY